VTADLGITGIRRWRITHALATMRWRTDSPESEGKSMTTTNPPAVQAGSYRVGDLDLNRIGYGAMQLAGPGVFGLPRDRTAAIEVLRTAVELGVNHIDTADAYGPHITNEIIREALFPYSHNVHIVTKIGVVRDERGGWLPANSPESLREQVHDNLRRLGLDVLDVVNLRTLVGIYERATVSDTLVPQFEALAKLQQQGLIRHLGLSTVSLDQLAEAQQIAPVVCVQNFYNIANRADEAMLAATAEQHIAYVPYFPLGGFSPLQSDVLELVAKRLDATPMAVAQSWLLQHSPNIMLIPGTSSVAHLRENIAGAALTLPPDVATELDAIAAAEAPAKVS
jgi:pyridoxine 4-dehydrogenase